MKFIRYRTDDGPAYGALKDGGAVNAIDGDIFGNYTVGARVAYLDDLHLLAPVDPPTVIGAGANYLAHILELQDESAIPQFPMLFALPSTSIIGPDQPITLPRREDFTHAIKHPELRRDPLGRVELEAELVAVIGKTCRAVHEDEALDYVLGYTCGNDVSARGLQFAEMATGVLMMGKGMDSFKPLGPCIATDLDPTNLAITSRRNGETLQQSNTSDLLFSVASLITYLAQGMTLRPGDCIYTGTPAGVGAIKPGDTIEIEVEGIGILRNSVVAA
jgi:2-keto-4-pentenoate hydratase/2-oxohepta-3-ene-1,7-dioic acid hydratase in catechol pathway